MDAWMDACMNGRMDGWCLSPDPILSIAPEPMRARTLNAPPPSLACIVRSIGLLSCVQIRPRKASFY